MMNSPSIKFIQKITALLICLCTGSWLYAQKTPFELGNGNQSASYQQCIRYYRELGVQNEEVGVLTYGETDSGLPLHLVVISEENAPLNSQESKTTFIQKAKADDKSILLIMNGIHPGEPDGIDASMMLARDLLKKKRALLKNTVVCIIPVYNVGGALNRNCCSRANQNGPELYGFRGNAKNLDLNRDFVKADSKNTWAFWEIFHEWRPDVFIDNHVTNGADYQHTMTLIASQIDKQNEGTKRYMNKMLPMLYDAMSEAGEPMSPYVNIHGREMGNEINAFFESPRYSTGYTSLFGCVSFVAETHMLKPFAKRVEATYTLMEKMLETMQLTHDDLMRRSLFTVQSRIKERPWPIRWEADRSRKETIEFMGYESEERESVIPGQKRTFYMHEKPYTKDIDFYRYYKVSDSVDKPFAYIIPQAWEEVAHRIEANRGLVRRANKDTSYWVHYYSIEDYKTRNQPYEGHYLHSEVKTQTDSFKYQVRVGDYFVIMPNRFAIETLEPRATDAFFAWNFFDPILQRKEGFSAYVFEDDAKRILQEQPEVKKALEEKRANDKAFRDNYYQQLYFIYQRSPYFEDAYLRYPVYKLQDVVKLPID